MFEYIKKYVSSISGGPPEEAKEKISENVKLAACVILLEAAYSDSDITERESRMITAILKDRFEVTGEEAVELIEFGKDIIENDTNKWRFMNVINRNFSVEEKLLLIEQVWQIILSDGRIDKYEDHIIRRISKVLRIPHHEMIRAKLKVMEGE